MADKVYQTDDYGQAAYLLLKDIPYLGPVGKKDFYKKFFIFEDGEKTRQEAGNWEHGLTDQAIQCKKYFIKISYIKKTLRDDTVDV